MTSSKAVFFFSLSFIIGIFSASASILIGVLFIFSFYLFFKKPTFVIFCLTFFLFGVFSYFFSFYRIPQSVENPFLGKVKEEPILQGDFQRVLVSNEGGNVLLYLPKHTKDEYRHGDTLLIDGDFKKPEKEYSNYFLKEKISHISFYPKIKKVGSERSFLKGFLFSLKEKTKENIQKSLPSPHFFFLEAVIIGDKSSFSKDLLQKLSISGTSHIVAVSGMHTAVISFSLFYLFLFLGVKRRWAAVFALFSLFFFILFVGAPPSAVRAGVMGGALLLSYIFYRQINLLHTLVFTAGVMLLFNPFLLYDIGFQLSFLSVTGIILLYHPLKNNLEGFFFKAKKTIFSFSRAGSDPAQGFSFSRAGSDPAQGILGLVSVTLSAQIFTFPLVLHHFGYLPLLSVPTNLLIVPLLPFILFFGFLTAFTGFFIFSAPSYIFLSFIIFVIDFFSSIPFSALFVENFPISLLIILYIIIFYKTYKLTYYSSQTKAVRGQTPHNQTPHNVSSSSLKL